MRWLKDKSELLSAVNEEGSWRYIRFTCHTDNNGYITAFNNFITEIEPECERFINRLNNKFLKNQYLTELKKNHRYINLIRKAEMEAKLFREENVLLFTEIQKLEKEYNRICGDMTIMDGEKELTLQQATNFLKKNDRALRQNFYERISKRRLQDKDQLDELFSKLIRMRHQMALNAGYSNFRNFSFDLLERFDYTIADCHQFHNSIQRVMCPLNAWFAEKRKQGLKLTILKPWDLLVDARGMEPVIPFNNTNELIEKSINCFDAVNPYFAVCLNIMNESKHLDLESRKAKAPGGYNCPLDETGIPFIFMNSASSFRDMITMLHEGGHAVHSFAMNELELREFRHVPSEIAELASMGMELLSMNQWNAFIQNSEQLRQAKLQHLEQIISLFPWISLVDKFQHWVYENPFHSPKERGETWKKMFEIFHPDIADWSGYEDDLTFMWQKQNHIFTSPFYYIEYAFAQLGALALWKNNCINPNKTLQNYLDALKLGFTKSIPEVYDTAGIKFDFTEKYLLDVCDFVKKEFNELLKS